MRKPEGFIARSRQTVLDRIKGDVDGNSVAPSVAISQTKQPYTGSPGIRLDTGKIVVARLTGSSNSIVFAPITIVIRRIPLPQEIPTLPDITVAIVLYETSQTDKTQPTTLSIIPLQELAFNLILCFDFLFSSTTGFLRRLYRLPALFGPGRALVAQVTQ